MIKVETLEELQTLMVLKNICRKNSSCDGCQIENICSCVSIEPIEFEIHYQEKNKNSDDLKVILKNLDSKYRWIFRNSNLDLVACEMEPENGYPTGEYINLSMLFRNLSSIGNWYGSPMLIEDMLKGE